MKFVLGTAQAVVGLFVLAMMQYTSMGYSVWGVSLVLLSLCGSVLIFSDRG